MNLAEAKKFFENDYFAMNCGIQIDEVSEGEAICSFEIQESHRNAGGAVQGGAIFTLADFAFAVAANSKGRLTVSLENQIAFMHVAKGKKLIATAKEVSSTRSVCFYDVYVEDEIGNKVAKMSVVGYMK